MLQLLGEYACFKLTHLAVGFLRRWLEKIRYREGECGMWFSGKMELVKWEIASGLIVCENC